jgi:hypothetical protein
MFKLKLTFAYLGLFMLFSHAVYSQTVGIKLGPVYNHFISDQQHVKDNLGVVIGLDYIYPLSDKLNLSAGIEYLQLGGGLLTIEDNTRYGVDFNQTAFPIKYRDSKVTLHTVNIPVIANYEIYELDKASISIGVGPEVSYTLKAKSVETITGPLGDGMYGTYDQTNDETNNYQKFNIAAALNLRIELPIASNNMFLDCRYRYGFTPIREGYSYLDLNDVKSNINQGSFIMTFGYSFNFSKSE